MNIVQDTRWRDTESGNIFNSYEEAMAYLKAKALETVLNHMRKRGYLRITASTLEVDPSLMQEFISKNGLEFTKLVQATSIGELNKIISHFEDN